MFIPTPLGDAKEEGWWVGLTEAVNLLHTRLQQKPRELRSSYQMSPGGILNAYREGDISFKKAVRGLEKWKNSK